MPYLVTTSYYPSDKAEETAKITLEMIKKYPDDKKLGETIVFGSTRTPNGIKGLSIREIKKGKLDAAVDFVNKRVAMFYGVAGYESKTEIYSTLEEGMGLLGIKVPK
jgi:hypothetical protein